MRNDNVIEVVKSQNIAMSHKQWTNISNLKYRQNIYVYNRVESGGCLNDEFFGSGNFYLYTLFHKK